MAIFSTITGENITDDLFWSTLEFSSSTEHEYQVHRFQSARTECQQDFCLGDQSHVPKAPDLWQELRGGSVREVTVDSKTTLREFSSRNLFKKPNQYLNCILNAES